MFTHLMHTRGIISHLGISHLGRVALAGGVVAMVGLFTGCGGDTYKGDARARVYGTVTYQGQPVDNGVIYFEPPDNAGGAGRQASGFIQNGKYDIPEANGPNRGRYVVRIRWEKPREGAKPSSEGDIPTQNVLPPKYNDRTELSLEVDSSSIEKNWDLQ